MTCDHIKKEKLNLWVCPCFKRSIKAAAKKEKKGDGEFIREAVSSKINQNAQPK